MMNFSVACLFWSYTNLFPDKGIYSQRLFPSNTQDLQISCLFFRSLSALYLISPLMCHCVSNVLWFYFCPDLYTVDPFKSLYACLLSHCRRFCVWVTSCTFNCLLLLFLHMLLFLPQSVYSSVSIFLSLLKHAACGCPLFLARKVNSQADHVPINGLSRWLLLRLL